MDFVTFEEVKQRLGKTDEQLQEMIKKGELRAFRDGGTWKFRKEDIDALAPVAGSAPAEAGDTLMSIDADILFAEEEEQPADSAAETWIAADTEGVFPQGAGEQRGAQEAMAAPEAQPAPLALSPETDESSLGAVLSEEELGGGEAPSTEPVIGVDPESGMPSVVPASASGGPSRTRIIELVEPPAHHGAFTFVLAISVVGLALAILGIMAAMTGTMTMLVTELGSGMTPIIAIVAVAIVAGGAAAVGLVFEKQRAAREAASA